jgi:hypothetical protein
MASMGASVPEQNVTTLRGFLLNFLQKSERSAPNFVFSWSAKSSKNSEIVFRGLPSKSRVFSNENLYGRDSRANDLGLWSSSTEALGFLALGFRFGFGFAACAGVLRGVSASSLLESISRSLPTMSSSSVSSTLRLARDLKI